MAWALSTRQACFCRSANFDEEYTGNGFMNLIEKKNFLSFDMYTNNYTEQSIDLHALFGWNKFRKHPYISDRYSGLPP